MLVYRENVVGCDSLTYGCGSPLWLYFQNADQVDERGTSFPDGKPGHTNSSSVSSAAAASPSAAAASESAPACPSAARRNLAGPMLGAKGEPAAVTAAVPAPDFPAAAVAPPVPASDVPAIAVAVVGINVAASHSRASTAAAAGDEAARCAAVVGTETRRCAREGTTPPAAVSLSVARRSLSVECV